MDNLEIKNILDAKLNNPKIQITVESLYEGEFVSVYATSDSASCRISSLRRMFAFPYSINYYIGMITSALSTQFV